MKNFKKIMGVILVLCLVITQFPVIGGKRVKAAETGTKTEVTSSKISFDYEKAKQEEATKFTYYGNDVAGFNGNGDYEIEHQAWVYNDGNGFQNIGYFGSDVSYSLKNITLVVNGTYEFLLDETKDSSYSEDESIHKVDCPNIWNAKDYNKNSATGNATLKYSDELISLYVNDTKTSITSSKIKFTYEKPNPGELSELKFCDNLVDNFNNEDSSYEINYTESMYNSGNGFQNIGYFAGDASYTLKNITLTVNNTYEFVLKDTAVATKDGDVYKVDLPSIYNITDDGALVCESTDGNATLKRDGEYIGLFISDSGDNQPGDGDGDNQPGGDGDSQPDDGNGDGGSGDNQPGGDGKPQEPGKVKTEITSSKLSFTYENTGEGEAKALKVCGAEISGFNGNGTYEASVAEKGWETWDKTGYYNLGFIESDTAYTLKNVILIVNGTYEFVLGETFNSEEKEGVFKVDFPNIWGGYKENQIICTSKDKKATLVFDGTLISLFVSDDKGDDSDNTGSGDDNQKPGGDDTQKPGDGDTQEPDRVQVDIKSSKLSFTYEKTGETDATFLKVSGMDVNGFNGNGTYEIDILESAWNTWDKTGYYNLGFVESDAAYTLKNVVVTVNGTYEFVLEEIKAASYKEDENLYKVDFINMWSGHKEGDVLYTSKDGKAALVSGGNTAVISLMVDKAAVPTPKPFLPPYAVTPPTTAPVATTAPTAAPTAAPTVAPTTAPTSVPTVNPTTVPTVTPVATVAPTKEPVTAPSSKPEEPSDKPDGANDIQKGDKVTVSGQKYEVTNNSKKTVAYVAAKGSKKASVSVPATVKVTVNGKKVTYKVTSIKDKAFKGNKKIKTITVSKNITSIGKDAFKNCSKLKTIVIKSTSITKVGKDALKGTSKNLVIKVPANKVSAYKKLFKNKGNNNIIVKKA